LYPEEIFRGAGEAAVVDIQQRRRTMNWLADVIVVAWFFPVVVYGLIPLMIGVGWALGKLFGGVGKTDGLCGPYVPLNIESIFPR
jgi:hypothetical protein